MEHAHRSFGKLLAHGTVEEQGFKPAVRQDEDCALPTLPRPSSSMRGRRPVITGIGVIAPNGIGVDRFWANLTAGNSAVSPISHFNTAGLPCRIAAQARDFDPVSYMSSRRAKHLGRFSQFAVAATRLALADANLALDAGGRARMPVCLGTSVNGMGDIFEASYAGFQRSGIRGFPPMAALEYAAHAAASHVSAEFGFGGQALTLASACTTGLDAVNWAATQIEHGVYDLALAGATDAPIAPFSFAAISALGVLTPYAGPPQLACRPYDFCRDGLVLGEGAALFVLESLANAARRSAPIYAEVLGFGSGNEGSSPTRVDAAELALSRALTMCLDSASISPNEVDHINAHGNGLPDYDLVETLAFKRVLGHHAYSIPVASIKPITGHAMGAASALQLAAACLSVRYQIIPPTLNLTTPDPACDLDYVPRTSRNARLRRVLVNAHAMGGTHSLIALGNLI